MEHRKIPTKAAKSILSYSVPITEDILLENKHDPEAIVAALKSLGSWAASTAIAKLDLLKGNTYLPRLVKLLYSENTEIKEATVDAIVKITSRMTFVNDTLRELGALVRINELVEEPSYNYEHILNLGQAVGNLIKCVPHQIREIGLGLDHETGVYETVFRVKQHDMDKVGVGWRVWDAAITFSRWIYLNKALFEKKVVLELGSGPGLSGIVAAMHANAVVLSDYIPQLLNTMKENIKLNTPSPILNKNKLHTTLIDFNSTERVEVPEFLKDGVDVIIGSEVNYYPEVAKILANAINLYLKTDGVFYGISPTFRPQGNTVLVEELTQLGFNVELKFPNSPEIVVDDAGETLLNATMEKDNNPPIIKILLVGERLSGKTQLFLRYGDGVYDETYSRPIGVDFKFKIVTSPETNKAYKVQIWDPNRPERFVQPRTQTYYARIMGMVFVLDLTNKSSFDFLRNELRLAQDLGTKHMQKILVGAKCDDAANRKISAQEAQEFADSFNMPYYEVSALADQNVTEAITALIRMIEPVLHQWDTPQQVAPPNTGSSCILL